MLNNEHHIKSIHMIDFLSHKDTFIEFGPLTTIIGANLAGKTCIKRALEFALLNKGMVSKEQAMDNVRRLLPNGELADKAVVTVEFNDGLIVERSKGVKSGTSYYRYVDKSGEEITIGKKGTSVGRGVPQEIEQLTGFREIVWPDKTKTAIQFQNDAVEGKFLLSDKSVSVDAKLGFIIGADIIESATKQATTEGISKSRERTKALRDLDEIKLRVTKFDGLEDVADKLATLQTTVDKANAMQSITEQGTVYSDKYQALTYRLGKLEALSAQEGRFNALLETVKGYEALIKTYHRANDHYTLWTRYNKLPDADVIDTLDRLLEKLYAKQAEYTAMRDAVNTAVRKFNESVKLIAELAETGVRLEQEQSKLISSVNVCPLDGKEHDECILKEEL